MSSKTGESLDSLLEALHSAVSDASKITELQHIDRIRKFFDKDGNAKMMPFRNPLSLDNKEFEIPEICLSPMNSMAIEEMEVEIKVRMNNITNGRGEKGDRKSVGIDSISWLPSSKEKVKLKIKFKSRDVPEGFSRLIESYIKTIP